jgi:hypothetical protein
MGKTVPMIEPGFVDMDWTTATPVSWAITFDGKIDSGFTWAETLDISLYGGKDANWRKDQNDWFSRNSKAIKEAGLEDSLQVSSWVAVATLTTAMNSLAATSATNYYPPGAYGWGYMYAPQMVMSNDSCGGAPPNTGAIPYDYWYECDANSVMNTCFPVDWNKWTSYGAGTTVNTYSDATALDTPKIPGFTDTASNSWEIQAF